MNTNLKWVAASVAAIGALALTSCAGPADADAGSSASYPTKTITYIVPYAPGGSSDLNSRALMKCVGDELGQTVVVENRDGGAGAVGIQELLNAAPDGYTIGYGVNGPMVTNPLTNDLGYSPADFTPIAGFTAVPSMIVVGSGSRFGSAEDLFDEIRSKPDSVTIGVPGATSSMGIELRRLEREYGLSPIVVPASGSAELTTELLGNHVDAVWINDENTVKSQIDTGAFVPLAVSTEERLESFPDVPTLVELGFPELTRATSIPGIFGPGGMDEKVTATLESAIHTCADDPGVREQIGERFMQYFSADEIRTLYSDMWDLYSELLGSK